MSTALRIVEIRTQQPARQAHSHVAQVKIDGAISPVWVGDVISDLRFQRRKYYVYTDGRRREVVVGLCPECGFGDYIATTPTVERNRLFDLPNF